MIESPNPNPCYIGKIKKIEYLGGRWTEVVLDVGGALESLSLPGDVRADLSKGDRIKAYMDGTYEKLRTEK